MPHLQNKGMFEQLFGCCCGARNQDLNKREAKYWRKFKESMIKEYDQKNVDHEYNLKHLWLKAFKGEEMENDENGFNTTMVNNRWKDIGFQGKNPRTDFRGGGHLSLLSLIYFVENYPAEFDELAKCTKDQEELMWLTAISSINITHNIVIYLYLNEGEVAPSSTKLRAGRIQFKKFCKLNYMNKKTFFELNSFCLRHLYKTWIDLVNITKKDSHIAGLMGSFGTCMDTTKLAMHHLLDEEIIDFQHLKRKCESKLKN